VKEEPLVIVLGLGRPNPIDERARSSAADRARGRLALHGGRGNHELWGRLLRVTQRIRFYATLRDAVGGRDPDVALTPPFTARQLVEHVVTRWPDAREWLLEDDGALRRQVHIFVNGRDARYLDGGLDATIRAEDTVDVFPAVGGG